jgi:DNA-binding NarL/FixJ family response regulator
MDEVDSQRKVRVFVADDSVLVRERLIALLNGIGNVEIVGQARNAAEAIASIREARPDIVVLDIRMPDGSGITVLEGLRGEIPAPKVIMLTNYPFAQYRRKCLEAGASFFFDKSTEFHKIPNAVEQLSDEEVHSPGPSDSPPGEKS